MRDWRESIPHASLCHAKSLVRKTRTYHPSSVPSQTVQGSSVSKFTMSDRLSLRSWLALGEDPILRFECLRDPLAFISSQLDSLSSNSKTFSSWLLSKPSALPVVPKLLPSGLSRPSTSKSELPSVNFPPRKLSWPSPSSSSELLSNAMILCGPVTSSSLA